MNRSFILEFLLDLRCKIQLLKCVACIDHLNSSGPKGSVRYLCQNNIWNCVLELKTLTHSLTAHGSIVTVRNLKSLLQFKPYIPRDETHCTAMLWFRIREIIWFWLSLPNDQCSFPFWIFSVDLCRVFCSAVTHSKITN